MITKNKSRIVVLGYTQIKGIGFRDTFSPISHFESIGLLVGLACFFEFKLYQIDVKSVILNGMIKEEVEVELPKGFKDPYFPNHVIHVRKALYGLKQSAYALIMGFKEVAATKLFLFREEKGEGVVDHVYIDEIVFGFTKDDVVQDFALTMKNEFEMDLVGELKFFLGFQVK